MPISKTLVKNVEESLRKIVQSAIDHSLSKFPTLKKAVEAKVVNKIFETKRDQTIQFIRQFLEMQKKSIDMVFAPVPFPDEISTWENCKVIYQNKTDQTHPCMSSRTMNQMKHLTKKLYPQQMMSEIDSSDLQGSYKVRELTETIADTCCTKLKKLQK